MWGVVPSARHDWAKLREDINKYVTVFCLLLLLYPVVLSHSLLKLLVLLLY